MNKIFTGIIVLTFITSAGWADESRAVPKELEHLKKAYYDARQRALKPIESKYRNKLVKLQQKLTAAGDLDGALAVRDELAAFDKATPKLEDNQGAEGSIVGEWERTDRPIRLIFLQNGYIQKWVDGKEELRPDGTPYWDRFTWKLVDKKIKIFVKGSEIASARIRPDNKIHWSNVSKGGASHNKIFKKVEKTKEWRSRRP